MAGLIPNLGGGKRKLQQEMGASALITGMKCNFGLQLEVVIVAMEIEEERGPTDGQQRRLGVCPKRDFKPRVETI